MCVSVCLCVCVCAVSRLADVLMCLVFALFVVLFIKWQEALASSSVQSQRKKRNQKAKRIKRTGREGEETQAAGDGDGFKVTRVRSSHTPPRPLTPPSVTHTRWYSCISV